MALDYFLLVFTSSIGVYQIASIPAKLKGLWFFGHPVLQGFFGFAVIISSIGWFFSDENRNFQHTVEGAQQLGLFLFAIIAAYICTAIIASIIQSKVRARPEEPIMGKQHEEGIETLKSTTVLGGILSSLRKERKSRLEDED